MIIVCFGGNLAKTVRVFGSLNEVI